MSGAVSKISRIIGHAAVDYDEGVDGLFDVLVRDEPLNSKFRTAKFGLKKLQTSFCRVRRSQDFLWGALFSLVCSKKLKTFLVVALKTQAKTTT